MLGYLIILIHHWKNAKKNLQKGIHPSDALVQGECSSRNEIMA
jgi:hypothetical protein